jgi:hypothetical protein
MTRPSATVIVPTHDHGPTLEPAVGSALAQTVEELEVLVIGDGATEETRRAARALAERDTRMRFLDQPKAASRGETLRHQALQEARGEIVCYLSDDDLWLPDHVETMLALLERADFATSPALVVNPGRARLVHLVDLALPAYRQMHVGGENRVPLSCAAHTLEIYRRLPHGWRAAPAGKPTDLHMWQQVLAEPSVRCASGYRPTVVNFPSPTRRGWSNAERAAELAEWGQRIEREPELLAREAAAGALREATRREAELRTQLAQRERSLGEHASALQATQEELRGAARELEGSNRKLERVSRELALREELLGRVASTLTWRLRESLLGLPPVEAAWRWLRGRREEDR